MERGITRLVEWVGASSPPGKEQAQADSFEDSREGSDSDSVERSLFGEDLRDELNCKQVSNIQRPKFEYIFPDDNAREKKEDTYAWSRTSKED